MLQSHADLFGSDADSRRRRSSADFRVMVGLVVRLGDLLVVAASGLAASRLRFAEAGQPAIATAALLIGILLAANVFSLLRLYDHERIPQLGHQLPRLLVGWAVTIGGVLAVLYGLKVVSDLSRLWLGYWFAVGCGGLVLWRSAVRLTPAEHRQPSQAMGQARGALERALAVLNGCLRLVAGPRHACRDRARACGLLAPQGLGRSRLQRRYRCGIDLELVERKNKTKFEVEPKRRRIEEIFGVLGRYRRHLIDHEGGTTMSRIMTLLFALFMIGSRSERQITA